MKQELTFITGNSAKAKYLAEYFHLPIAHKKLDVPEIQSLDLREVVEAKAKSAYAILGSPVLVEDVSVTFTALKRLPGPLIKWFLETLGNDGLCKLLDGYDDRSAVAEVMFGFCDGEDSGEVHIFHGRVEGHISANPRGETKFGWDPVFIPSGQSEETWAEMSGDEKHATSMRKPALEQLAIFLNSR
jgi:non-canonical purine NTP pyrophosphatase (RdgB/HAM1 family)